MNGIAVTNHAISLDDLASSLQGAVPNRGETLVKVKSILLHHAIACAEDAQRQNNNTDALRDLSVALIRKDLTLYPMAERIARRITFQESYVSRVNYREEVKTIDHCQHALGMLAEACAQKGSHGFFIARQLLAGITDKKESYTTSVIYHRANERTPLAFNDAVVLFRQMVPNGQTTQHEHVMATLVLYFVQDLLAGKTILESATHISQLEGYEGRKWEIETFLHKLSLDEAKQGNIVSAFEIAKLLAIMNFRGDALSYCVKCRAEMSDENALIEAEAIAQNDMGPFLSHAKKYLAVAAAKKGVYCDAAYLASIQHLVVRTEAVRDMALLKGLAEGENYFEAILNDDSSHIYHQLESTNISDQLRHAFAQEIGQSSDAQAFSNAKQLAGRIQSIPERDRALKDLALMHAQKGSGTSTREAIETILSIQDPSEKSRAFGALALHLTDASQLPTTDLEADSEESYLNQVLQMISPSPQE